MNKSLILIIGLIINVAVFAQNPKKYLKSGIEFAEDKRYKEAIEDFTKAIEMDNEFVKAYVERAKSYEKTHEMEKAALDYAKATSYDRKDELNFYNAGRVYMGLKKHREALKYLEKATEINKKYVMALELQYQGQMIIKDFNNALTTAELTLDAEKTAGHYFNKAEALDSLRKHQDASYNYNRAIIASRDMTKAYVGLAYSRLKEGKSEDALKACNDLIERKPGETAGYKVRSAVYFKMNNFEKAINDLSKIIALDAKDSEALFTRGLYYQKLNQHSNAVNDFTSIIDKNPKNHEALFCRGASFEALNQYKKAIKDYEKLRKLAPYDPVAAQMYDQAKERMFELNREEVNPIVKLDGENTEGVLEVPIGGKKIKVKGVVTDDSKIKYIKINGNEAIFKRDQLNPEFVADINIDGKDKFTLTVEDVYKNKLDKVYTFQRTEIDPPIIKLRAPVASHDGTIYLDNNESTLYIEGVIKDASKIKSVVVEGANASFVIDQLNPTFSATISIANKNKIQIKATDIYNNEVVQEYTFNREGAVISANNPMGKTWVVFVENSDYSNFASLDGPEKDIRMMKSEFANYEIHNIIHKKNMSKADMEKFFSIELRDLVKANRVNSVLIWYAGHGKFVNETGYWIPTNAKRDDEFTYFNINSLKAAMQSYDKYLSHTLVISDACESGPSFYQAMRSTNAERRCDDYTATQFKSSQVFSSAGYELASDNSQFTKTFAKSLKSNTNACIPIDKIVVNVSTAVTKSGNQKPKFGNISGLEDENGTFFFVKKK